MARRRAIKSATLESADSVEYVETHSPSAKATWRVEPRETVSVATWVYFARTIAGPGTSDVVLSRMRGTPSSSRLNMYRVTTETTLTTKVPVRRKGEHSSAFFAPMDLALTKRSYDQSPAERVKGGTRVAPGSDSEQFRCVFSEERIRRYRLDETMIAAPTA